MKKPKDFKSEECTNLKSDTCAVLLKLSPAYVERFHVYSNMVTFLRNICVYLDVAVQIWIMEMSMA